MNPFPDIDPEDLICRCGRHKPCRHCEEEPGVELAPEKNSEIFLDTLRTAVVASARNQTTPMNKTFIATQIRNNKVVQSIIVRESDFEDLKAIAQCEPRSVWSIEDKEREGVVVEVLK